VGVVGAARAGERGARLLGARVGVDGRVREATPTVGFVVDDLDTAARAAGWWPDEFNSGLLILWAGGRGARCAQHMQGAPWAMSRDRPRSKPGAAHTFVRTSEAASPTVAGQARGARRCAPTDEAHSGAVGRHTMHKPGDGAP